MFEGNTKQQLIANLKSQNLKLQDVFVFSQDLSSNHGAKKFFAYPSINYLSKIKTNEDHHLYEVIPHGRPVKPYIDFDAKVSGKSKDEIMKILLDFQNCLDCMGQALVQVCGMKNYHFNDWFIAQSHRTTNGKEKVSYHAILDNGFCFKNNQDQKIFINWFIKHSPQYTQYIDPVPYSKFQSLRMLNQSKMGKNNPLKPDPLMDDNNFNYFVDTLAGGYFEHSTLSIKPLIVLKNFFCRKKIQQQIQYQTQYQQQTIEQVGESTIQYCLNHIPADDYRTWISIGSALKNMGFPVQVWDNWSKKSAKYDPSAIQRTWNSLNMNHSIATILFYAKMNQDFRFPNTLKKENIYLPIGWETEKYNERFLKPIPANYDNVIIHSAMGTGKTHTIKQLISQYPPEQKFIFVSPRRTLSWDIDAELTEFGFLNYLRKADMRSIPDNQLYRIIVSFESFRFNPDALQDTIIIIDESKTAFASISSITMKDREDYIQKINLIETALRYAKKVIAMDAYITPKTINIINTLRPNKPSIHIRNFFKNYNENVIVKHAKDAKNNFLQYVQEQAQKLKTINQDKPQYEKKGIYVYCHSVSTILTEIAPALEELGVSFATICSKDAYRKFERHDLLQKQLALIRNPNDEWFKYEFIIGSPALSIGVNYDDKSETLAGWKILFDIVNSNDKHFIQRIAYLCSFSSNASDASQGLKRVRNTDGSKNDMIFVSTRPNTQKIDNDEFLTGEYDTNDFYERAKRSIHFKDQLGQSPTPEWVQIATAYDAIENKMSNIAFLKQFEYYFKIYHNGSYTAEEIQGIITNKEAKEETDIPTFDEIDEKSELYQKKKYLIQFFGDNAPAIWDLYMKHKSWYKIEIIKNLLSNTPPLKNTFNIFQDKYKFIKPLYDEFKSLLNIENIHTTKVIENLDVVKDWIMASQKQFDIVLPRKSQKKEGQMNLKAINHYIGILGFISIERKRKRVKGSKERYYEYTLKPLVENLEIKQKVKKPRENKPEVVNEDITWDVEI